MMTMGTLRSTLIPIEALCNIQCEQDNPYLTSIRQTNVVVPRDRSRNATMRNLMTALLYHFGEGSLCDIIWSRDNGIVTLSFTSSHTITLGLK